jgi:hypothetical protein
MPTMVRVSPDGERWAIERARITQAIVSGADYTVMCQRSFKVPYPADRDSDEIHIWGEGRGNAVWTVTCDERTDALTLARPHSSETQTLKRLSD